MPVDPTLFSVDRSARWVNGLWFSSLALTLFVGLLAILAKQWLGEYDSRMRAHVASHRRWVWRHLVYNAGLHSWRIDAFISTLPFLLHIALFLFIFGLIVFLTSLDWAIAGVVLGLTATIVAVYAGAMLAPLWYGNCPTATPILRQARSFLFGTLHYFSTSRIGRRLRTRFSGPTLPAYSEDILMSGHNARRDATALTWMISTLPAMEEVDVAVDAIGSLDILQHQDKFLLGDAAELLDLLRVRSRTISRLRALAAAGDAVDPAALGRCLRSLLFLDIKARDFDVREPMLLSALDKWSSIKTHDVYLLCARFNPSDSLLGEVVQVIAKWSLKFSQSSSGYDGISPCLPSTMALMVGLRGEHARVAPDYPPPPSWLPQPDSPWSQHLLCSLFCYSLEYIIAGDPQDFERACTAFELLSRAVLLPILGTQEVQSLSEQQRWPPLIDQDSMRLRGLLVLGHVIQALGKGPTEGLHMLAIGTYNSTLAGLLSWSDPLQRISSSQMENCLWYVSTPDFAARQTWEPNCLTATTRLLLSVFRPRHWSATLGDITRNVAAKLALGQKDENLAREGARLLTGLVQSQAENCAQTTLLMAIQGSTEEALHSSYLNLLQPSASGEVHSVWHYAWTLRWPERDIMLKLADNLVQHILYLHRNGYDISALLEELLRNHHGPHLALMATGQSLLFFVHLREISPSCWDRASQELVGLPKELWLPSAPDVPDAATFIRLVNEHEGCQSCSNMPNKIFY